MNAERESHPSYENGQDIRDRSFEFACRAVCYAQTLFERGGVARIMVPQLVDAATALPAMLEEAQAAESRRDFISKCSIGLKEVREARVRLRICVRVERAAQADGQSLVSEASEIVAIVGAIIRNTRRNAGLPLDPNRRDRLRIPNSQS